MRFFITSILVYVLVLSLGSAKVHGLLQLNAASTKPVITHTHTNEIAALHTHTHRWCTHIGGMILIVCGLC